MNNLDDKILVSKDDTIMTIRVPMKGRVVDHTKKELHIHWGPWEDRSIYGNVKHDMLIAMAKILIEYPTEEAKSMLKMVENLIQFRTIGMIRFTGDAFEGTTNFIRRHLRDSRFSRTPAGKIIHHTGVIFKITLEYLFTEGEEAKFETPIEAAMYSGAFVLKEDGSIGHVNACFLKESQEYSKEFEVESYRIEMPCGNWIVLTTEENLSEAREYYDIPYTYNAEELLEAHIDSKKWGNDFDADVHKRINELREFLKETPKKETKSVVNASELITFMSELRIVPYRDGNKWCSLYGSDIQSGIAGFGDSPMESVINLREELYKTIK